MSGRDVFFGASAAASPCGATLWGSQVCSALRRLRLLGLAFGHPAASLGQFGLRPKAAKPPSAAPNTTI
nr:hypothetical protein [Saprospira grandis]